MKEIEVFKNKEVELIEGSKINQETFFAYLFKNNIKLVGLALLGSALSAAGAAILFELYNLNNLN